jgi:hypothetical protein
MLFILLSCFGLFYVREGNLFSIKTHSFILKIHYFKKPVIFWSLDAETYIIQKASLVENIGIWLVCLSRFGQEACFYISLSSLCSVLILLVFG